MHVRWPSRAPRSRRVHRDHRAEERVLRADVRDPDLQRDFRALATRYGIELPGGELSDSDLARVSGGTDSSSELGDEQSLTMQAYMGRMSKTSSALSNLLKKQSSTASTIAGHLK